MTLHLEAVDPNTQRTIEIGVLQPGQTPGSLSQNLPDGGREVYLFGCAADNSHSFIQKSVGGVDIATSQIREVISTGLQPIAVLKVNESYALTLLTDNGSVRSIVKFTHK